MLDVVASLDVGPTSPQFLHLSDVLRTVGTMGHAADCLKTRYIDLSGDDIEVRIELGLGDGTATIRTTDLSHGYVEENSAYSS